jgi:nucleoside-diphosphate-sugar epimerase
MTVRTRAFVTGGNGFIGSHLIARLLDFVTDVRALVRCGLATHQHFQSGSGMKEGAARLERFRGDVRDLSSLERAVEGCDIVFHCAYGGASLPEARRINVEGTQNVVEAASRAGVRRVVHLSSMAVHGYRLPEVLTEECPLVSKADAYAVSKAEGEKAAFETGARLGVEIVALRPTLVYGPGSPWWLMSYFERTKNEQIALIDGGTALANLVWVGDLVDAMLVAWKLPAAAGEAFLISGPHPITWRDYIGHFARMCDKPMPPSVPRWRAVLAAPWLRAYCALTRRSRRLAGMDFMLMSQHTTVSIEKARRVLGYVPAFCIGEGMRTCEAWLRRHGHLPTASRRNIGTLLVRTEPPASNNLVLS